jgi:hypothetical protein
LPSGHDAECWGSGMIHEDPTEQQLLA